MVLQWQDPEGKFHPFDESFNFMPRNHLLDMFLNPTPVVAKEGEMYLTNSEALHSAYQKKRKKVMMFKDCKRSEERFEKVGFVG